MEIQTILPILLSWAVHLSDYPMPARFPAVEFVPHSFFVENVCGGKDCTAVGWYNDQDVIYIDERYMHQDTSFAHSLLVHELVHYLQDMSGEFDSRSCEHSRAREREAYHVQNSYIIQAEISIARISPSPTFCRYDRAFNAAVVPEEQ